MKRIRRKKHIYKHIFDLFYKQQFRKDLIDKLNVCDTNELDLSCKLKFRGYLRYNAFDRGPLHPKTILAYQYIFESIFNQRILFHTFVRRNIYQKDQPADQFYKYKLNMSKRKKIFAFLTILYVALHSQKRFGEARKPVCRIDWLNKNILIKNLQFYQTCWVKSFREINLPKDFHSYIQISSKNPLIPVSPPSRYQFTPLIKTTNFQLPDGKISKKLSKSR
jgi:hypothetical protein